MLTFKPAVWDGTTLHELPRPVTALRIQDAWDFAQFKVPLGDGDHVEGRSRNGVDIAIEGQIGTQAGTLTATEADMFAAIESLRDALDADNPESDYELFLYHDATAETYRSFRQCSTVRFEYDLSDARLFSYSVLIHAADPTIYTAAPA